MRFAYLITGNREQSRDLVQDAFIRVFARFGDLRTPDSFHYYLRRTIVNLARDGSRRRAVERRALVALQSDEDAVNSFDYEGRDELWVALMTLPVRQRAVLVLRYFDDLSERQTAQLMGCSVSAVKALAARGLETLRERIPGGNDVRARA